MVIVVLIVKAGYFKRFLLVNGFYGRSDIEIFRYEIMRLKKGDTAEIIGEFGQYRTVKIHKTGESINLSDKEIAILFKDKIY